jgi:hypothetical protein
MNDEVIARGRSLSTQTSFAKTLRAIVLRLVCIAGQRQVVYSDSSKGASPGRRLCLALRPAGLAFSSGFAFAIGCPGGAPGFLMLSKTDRWCRFLDLLPLLVAMGSALTCKDFPTILTSRLGCYAACR